MGSSDELKVMLRAIQEGWLPSDSLGRLSKEWLESGAPSILRFLVEKGCLSDEQIKSLETAINLNSSLSANQEQTSIFPGNTPDSPIKTDEEPGTPHSGSNHSTQAVPHFGPHSWVDSPLSQDRFSRKRFFRKGGPGQIWLVWDNALGRDVIVKTIRPELARKPAMLTRFLREARLTSQLEHPNIVPVYDLMGDEQNRDSWAYSMRYVNGPTLAEAVEKYHTRLARGEAGHLDLIKLLDSFILLCRAVAYAHSRHIIHRDLKGQNVILGDFGEVILLDWGLAKRVGDQDPEQTVDFGILNSLETEQITQPGSINGTPGFMSPEVARGEPASFLSDVYSLGAVLYAICCGRPPYRGSSAMETLDKVKEGPPPPPSRILPNLPRALEAITLKAIHRRPDQRYPSAEALAEDLRRWLADEPILAISDPVSVKVLRWAKKNRTQVQMVAGVIATALVGLVIGATLLWREKEQTEKQKVVAVANYQLARDLSQSSIGLMEKTEAYYTSNEELSRSRKTILDSTVNAYRSFLAQEPENNDLLRATANVLRYAANAHRLDDEFDQSQVMYTEAVSHLETVANALPGDVGVHSALAQTLRDWAVANQSQGELEASRGLFQQSIEVYRRCLPLTKARSGINRGLGLCRYELGEIHFGLGDYATSLELQNQAAETFGQLLGQSDGQSGKPYDRLLRVLPVRLPEFAGRNV